MIKSSREGDFTKQEGATCDNIDGKQQISRLLTSTSTSSWSRLKDPRIVRVSRAFGGKDRHSKVCTVKGLRDRRVRLSVPTAIQLYDLQDRLGLNQPSKVVDWLLNAAKHEIDELPPLQMPPNSGNFGQSFQQIIMSALPQSNKLEGLNWMEDHSSELSRSNYWNNSDKNKEVAISREEEKRDHHEEGRKTDREGNGTGDHQGASDHGAFFSSNNFFSRVLPNPSSSSVPPAGLLNNIMPSNSFLRWDPSNLSLSHFGTPHQTAEDVNHSFNVVHLPSMPSGSAHHQLLLYPPQTQSYFPCNSHANSGEINFQMLSQGMRPSHLSMNPKYFPNSQNNNESHDQPNKDS